MSILESYTSCPPAYLEQRLKEVRSQRRSALEYYQSLVVEEAALIAVVGHTIIENVAMVTEANVPLSRQDSLSVA